MDDEEANWVTVALIVLAALVLVVGSVGIYLDESLTRPDGTSEGLLEPPNFLYLIGTITVLAGVAWVCFWFTEPVGFIDPVPKTLNMCDVLFFDFSMKEEGGVFRMNTEEKKRMNIEEKKNMLLNISRGFERWAAEVTYGMAELTRGSGRVKMAMGFVLLMVWLATLLLGRLAFTVLILIFVGLLFLVGERQVLHQ